MLILGRLCQNPNVQNEGAQTSQMYIGIFIKILASSSTWQFLKLKNFWWSFLAVKSLQHLVVLPSECRDYNSQELLQSCLYFSCEAGTQGGGNDNGDAVSQQLYVEAEWIHVKLKKKNQTNKVLNVELAMSYLT